MRRSRSPIMQMQTKLIQLEKTHEVFNTTIELLERYIELAGYYPDWEQRKQIKESKFVVPVSSREETEKHLSNVLLNLCNELSNKPYSLREEIKQQYHYWIKAVGIDINNFPPELKCFLLEINEVLEGQSERRNIEKSKNNLDSVSAEYKHWMVEKNVRSICFEQIAESVDNTLDEFHFFTPKSYQSSSGSNPPQITSSQIIQDVKKNPQNWRINEILTEIDEFGRVKNQEFVLIHRNARLDDFNQAGKLNFTNNPIFRANQFNQVEIEEINKFLSIVASQQKHLASSIKQRSETIKKSLQDWYNNNEISYSEKERLNKIGVSDYDYHYLEDLKQILRCENWAKYSSEIRNKLDGRIKKIIFFTPNFNDSKPDASNYSCAIITDGSDNDWVIVYRPSYVANIRDDVVIKKVSNLDETESKLNGDYPITGITERFLDIPTSNLQFSDKNYLKIETLPRDVRDNPDKYLLPLSIVARPTSAEIFNHYAVYLGNEWVAHFPGGGESTKFDTWQKFYNPGSRNINSISGASPLASAFLSLGSFVASSSSSSPLFLLASSSSSSSSSSSLRSGNEKIICWHPRIPFKRKHNIIRHIAKAVGCRYGENSYNPVANNCENIVKGCVLGLNVSPQAELLLGPYGMMVDPVVNSNYPNTPLTERIEKESRRLDDLTYNYDYEKGRIERYIREAEDNRSYTRSRSQIKDEKFEERIVVYPKDWCRVS